MNDVDRLLIELLAAQDAVWCPLRAAEWQGRAGATFYEFRTSGTLPWRPADPTATQRKATERRLAHLADVGLVALSGRERRTQPRLTDAGDRHARALANLPGVDAGLSSVREVARRGGRVSELALAGLPNYVATDDCRSNLWLVEILALPALARSWLDSNSDCHGRAIYWATDAGLEAAELPEVAAELPTADDEAARLYDDERHAYRLALRTRTPDSSREIGFIPLPACEGART